MKPDIICQFVAVVREQAQIDDHSARRIERELRSRFGGESVRINRKPPVEMEEINAALRSRKPVAEIAAEFGVSRVTIYRRLKADCYKRRRGET